MRDELGRLRPDSAHALRADTYRLLVDLHRAAGPAAAAAARPSVAPAASARARALAARFEALVEERFRVDQRLASYAERLGVGTRHLGGVVRQVAGASPAECIRRRQFLEARRLLLQSSLSVGAIAESLNFADCLLLHPLLQAPCGGDAAALPRSFRNVPIPFRLVPCRRRPDRQR
jgi:AraC family transcriptional activator of pobA